MDDTGSSSVFAKRVKALAAAQQALKHDDPKKAVEFIESIATFDPKDWQFRMLLGLAYRKAGRLDSAYHIFSTLLAVPEAVEEARKQLGCLAEVRRPERRGVKKTRNLSTYSLPDESEVEDYTKGAEQKGVADAQAKLAVEEYYLKDGMANLPKRYRIAGKAFAGVFVFIFLLAVVMFGVIIYKIITAP